MKLVACKSCSHAIDRRAMKCPQCGAPRKTGTGMLKIIVLSVFVGFVLVCMLGSLNGKKSVPSTPTNTQPVAISIPQQPNPNPTKPIQPVAKQDKQVVPPISETTQPPNQLEKKQPVRDLDAELTTAKNSVAMAQVEVDKAKSAAIERLHQTPEYKAALQEVADATKKVEDDKTSGSPTLVESSKRKMEAKSRLAKMETDAVANDATVKSVQLKVAELSKSVEAIRSEIADRDAKIEAARRLEEAKRQAEESKKADELNSGVRGAGYMSAKKLVPQFLKNPDSAEFSWETVSYSVIKAGQMWEVRGIVRSTNSFNAVVPEQWKVVILYHEGNYFPAELSIGDNVVWRLK